MWFRDITKVNSLALEMSTGFKIIRENDDFIDFKINSPLADRVRINKKDNIFEILIFRKDKLCGYRSKINEENLIEELEDSTGAIFS